MCRNHDCLVKLCRIDLNRSLSSHPKSRTFPLDPVLGPLILAALSRSVSHSNTILLSTPVSAKRSRGFAARTFYSEPTNFSKYFAHLILLALITWTMHGKECILWRSLLFNFLWADITSYLVLPLLFSALCYHTSSNSVHPVTLQIKV